MEAFTRLFVVVCYVLVSWMIKLNSPADHITFYFTVSLALVGTVLGVSVIPLATVFSLNIPIYFYNCLFMCYELQIFTYASIMSFLATTVNYKHRLTFIF